MAAHGSDVSSLRHEYAAGGLAEDELAPDPVTMFDRWFTQARDAGLGEPNAMVVATADEQGRPSARTVLLKGYDERGFVFFTNLASRKGRELATRPWCSLLFPWHDLERQVRVEGEATELDRDEVATYFASRPRGSRLGAWASPQSEPVADRDELETAYAAAEQRFEGGDVPVPDGWGGYRVRPEVVEFWQGRPSRLHDRLVYRARTDDGWDVTRLAP